MRIAFLVGNPAVQRPGYTTTCLSYEAWRRDHDVGWIGADGLSVTPAGAVHGHALEAPAPAGDLDRAGLLAAIREASPRWWDLAACDVVVLRLLARPRPLDEDDGRYDTYYRARIEAVLAFASRLARPGGPVVTNDPLGLWNTHGKLLLAEIDENDRPRMIIARETNELRNFLDALNGPGVCKPLMGHGGDDVYLVPPGEPNRNSILATLGRQGYIVAQEFIPLDANGERRLLMLDGEPLRDPQTGTVAAYRRDPNANDWRGNVHQGASTRRAEALGARDLEIAERLGPMLRQRGLDFVGLDFRGDKLLEINSFCPGGIHLVQQRTGFDVAPLVIDAWERRVRDRSTA